MRCVEIKPNSLEVTESKTYPKPQTPNLIYQPSFPFEWTPHRGQETLQLYVPDVYMMEQLHLCI